MGVDRGVASRPSEILVLPVWDVQVSLRVAVFFGKTEIDDIDLVATLANAHEEVVRLDVSVDKVAGVNILDTGDKLVGKEENGLQAELPVAKVEQILQRRATTSVSIV